MRLFTALAASNLSKDPKLLLKKIKVNLNQKEIEYRWVPQENYHVTINFLGEVDPERLSELEGILTEVAQASAPFSLRVEGVGAFPEAHSGRVLWMGIQNSIALRELQSRCTELLRAQNFSVEDRDYSPHLTIARLRSPKNVSDIISPCRNTDFGDLAVTELTLYESKLGGSFPIYTPVKHFSLG